MTIADAILATTAGIIFFYVFITYEKHKRTTNSILIIVASIIDNYPLFFGSMAHVVNIAGAVHSLITAVAYTILIYWLITYSKKFYELFLAIWIVAYLTGYIAATM